MVIDIDTKIVTKGKAKLSALSANLSNALKCFPNIVFNNETMRAHLPSCFFIRINKKLTRLTILIKSVVFLAIHSI